MKKPAWEAEEHDDGEVHLRIDGELYVFNVDPQLPVKMKNRAISYEANRYLAEREYMLLQAKLEKAGIAIDSEPTTVAKKLNAHPPSTATAVFSLLASGTTADAQLGDLEELFCKNVDKFGSARARQLYWWQVLVAVRPALMRSIMSVLSFGAVVEFIRRKFGL